MTFAPFADPVVVDEYGRAWLPISTQPGFHLARVHTGLALGWAPRAEHALLNIVGGGDPNRSPVAYESVAFTLTRPGLQRLIADLTDIDAQLGEAR